MNKSSHKYWINYEQTLYGTGLVVSVFEYGIDTVAANIISQLSSAGALEKAANDGVFGGIGSTLNSIMLIFILIMMGYAVIKVF